MLTFQLKRRRELHNNNASKHNARCCDDAIFYAEAAHVAANLINNTAEELDSVHFH
jgi:hypothetical protein